MFYKRGCVLILLLDLLSSYLIVPPFIPFNFTGKEGNSSTLTFCTINETISYADIYDELVNESKTYLELFKEAGGMINYFREHADDNSEGIPTEILDMIDDSPLALGLECCKHPTSFLNLTFNFGCPRNVSVCVYDPRMDYSTQVVALFRPSGCCPIESPNGCYTRRGGNGLEGCCSDAKPFCCYNSMTNKWLGCVSNLVECCDDRICPVGYTCCRSKGSGGRICCPRYGGSCYDQDFFAYGLNRTVKAAFGVYYNDTDPSEQPMKLGDYYGLVYGYHGCIPAPGGELGPVKNVMYITDAAIPYADDYCEDKSLRTTQRIRPSLRRFARGPEDLDSNGIPFYEFNAINPSDFDLNISHEAARFGGIGDLDFIPCGRHLCYGERDYCVKRYLNDSQPINHRVINVTDIIIAYEALLDAANVDLSDGLEPPEPIDFDYLSYLNETCSKYNNTYLDELMAGDGPYSGLGTGVGFNPRYDYLLPTICLVYENEYYLKSHELGCCPKNSTPCASADYSLSPNISALWTTLYSIYDPMIGCAEEGETCCGSSICPPGFKCCGARFTADGGLPPIVPNGMNGNASGHITNLYLRHGMLYDLLRNATPTDRNYITDIFDIRSQCCPTYSFCCQVDSSFQSTVLHGNRFRFYCAVDPLCKIPIWNVGPSGVNGGVIPPLKGYPSQMLVDDLALDYNSDGRFEYVSDILETYSLKLLSLPETPSMRRDDGNSLNDVPCTLTVNQVGPIIDCGQLSGNFAPVPPPVGTSSVALQPLRAIGGAPFEGDSRRRNPKRSIVPNPPELGKIATFDILGIAVSVNLTDIFSMSSPLGYYFLQYKDYTIQMTLEAFFRETFINFPPNITWSPPTPSP